jgi:radical SAM superfamily enzyme YgiQ (UPF0313 family)
MPAALHCPPSLRARLLLRSPRSIASVRTNTVTPELAAALSGRGTRSLTVAVESGSQRVRNIVNKKLATEEIVQCAQNAQVKAGGNSRRGAGQRDASGGVLARRECTAGPHACVQRAAGDQP